MNQSNNSDVDSIYDSDQEENEDHSPRTINYLLCWRPQDHKHDIIMSPPIYPAGPSSNPDDGFYRNWFLQGVDIKLNICNIFNTFEHGLPGQYFSTSSEASANFDNHISETTQQQDTEQQHVPRMLGRRPSTFNPAIKLFHQNPYLYSISLKHGNFSWLIHKRYRDFAQLRNHIRLQKARLKLHLESRGNSNDRRELKYEENNPSARRSRSIFSRHRHVLPPFPKRFEIFVSESNIEQRKNDLETYLQAAVNIKRIRNNPELCQFLEISPISFIPCLGEKMKEGMVKKRNGERRANMCSIQYLCGLCRRWTKRWLFIKETCFGYLRPDTWEVADVILFDNKFLVRHGHADTGLKHGLQITSSGRRCTFNCFSERQMLDWVVSFDRVHQNSGRMFITPNRFQSFSPMRENTPVRWFVDGLSYFEALADAIESAREQIFITDWWLSPEIHLKRPYVDDYWRLDHLLERKAKAGVRVYILLYKEIQMALNINSFYSKCALRIRHKNIKILRHPDHLRNRILLWAHHEKMVAIDQKVCFMGGLDLCFGRWDTQLHSISDIGDDRLDPAVLDRMVQFEVPVKKREESQLDQLPMIQQEKVSSMGSSSGHVNRALSYDIQECELETSSHCNSLAAANNWGKAKSAIFASTASNESHPIRVNSQQDRSRLNQGCLYDVLSQLVIHPNAIQQRNDGQLVVKVKIPQKGEKRISMRHISSQSPTPRHSEMPSSQIVDQHSSVDVKNKLSKMPSIINEETLNIPAPEVFIDSLHEPSSPRHTIFGLAKVTKAAKKFIESTNERIEETTEQTHINHEGILAQLRRGIAGRRTIWMGKDYVNWIKRDCVDTSNPFQDLVDRGDVPRMPWHDIAGAVYGRCARDLARHFIQRWNAIKIEKAKSNKIIPFLIPKSYSSSGVSRSQVNVCHNATVQVLRSSCCWSAGLSHTEDSILQAHLHAIHHAQHYIYIENQFFITTCSDGELVHNRIGKAILEKITWAHLSKIPFRVFLVLPLLPAFEGEISRDGGAAIQAVLHYLYKSLNRGKNSLYENLFARNIDPREYISVCSLRTHGFLNKKLKTEIIYVHSKLMIVDDRVVIMGSANINDRSMLGPRDSELAIIVEDTKLVEGVLGCRPANIGCYASSLRVSLMREHLGVPLGHRLQENQQAPTMQYYVNLLRQEQTNSADIGSRQKEKKSDEHEQILTQLAAYFHSRNNLQLVADDNENHMNWDYDLLADPVAERFFNDVWQKTAMDNTAIYEKVFHCIPSNQVATYSDIQSFCNKPNMVLLDSSAATQAVKQVNGYLVEFPMEFLCHENLEPKTGTKEGFLPYQVWC